MLNVRASERDMRKRVRMQQARDERMRTEREQRGYAHEASQQALRQQGESARTQTRGEFGLAEQQSRNQAAIQQVGMQQTGAMKQTQLRQAAETGRKQMGTESAEGMAARTQAGLGERQQTTIGARRAAAKETEAAGARSFHRQLGAKAYLAGQDPATAQQLSQSAEWGTDYQGLKPVEALSKPETFAPKYSTEEVPRLITPGGTIDAKAGTRKFFDDEESIKAILRKLEKDEKAYQALR